MDISIFYITIACIEGFAFIGSIWHYEAKLKDYLYYAEIDNRIIDEYYEQVVEQQQRIDTLKKKIADQADIIETMDRDMTGLHVIIGNLNKNIRDTREQEVLDNNKPF